MSRRASSTEPQDDEWIPESQRVGEKGTVSLKVKKRAAVFDTVAISEMKKQEKQTVKSVIQRTILTVEALKVTHPKNLCAKHFDIKEFEAMDSKMQKDFMRITKSGVENPTSEMGCYAMNPTDYETFKPFFSKVLYEYHGIAAGTKHVNDWDLSKVEGLPEGGKLDVMLLGLPPLSMRVRVGRNLAAYPLPGGMSRQQRVDLEMQMCKAFDVLIANADYGGRYHSLTPGHKDFISDDEYNALVKAHIMFKDMSADDFLVQAGIASDWPHGRGCYVSEDRGFIIWVGEEDHLRIMAMKKGLIINSVFDRLKEALDVINAIEGLEFAYSEDYGVVTSCPTNIGTGMRASVHLQIPKLTADGSDAKAKAIAKPLGLSVRGMGGEHTPIGSDGTCDISPSARFCISEAEIVAALYKGIKLLKAEEDKY
eukprot:m.180030 g.180030  ORF g.180030 m.180030 type:complete len:424 (-) comp32000_c0_seq1:232-1503(-)